MRLTNVIMVVLALLLSVRGAAAQGFIGVKLADAPGQARRGALIQDVAANGPAALAGLQPGDIVTAVDRVTIANAAQLSEYVRSRRPGDFVAVELLRREAQIWHRLTLRVRLGGPREAANAGGGNAPPPMPAAGPANAPPPVPPTGAQGAPPPLPATGEGGSTPVVSQWTRFTDPNERAFVMNVPAGWRVEGGIIRGDIVPALRLTSPDGTMSMSINDARLRGLFNVPVGIMGERANPATRPYLPAPYFLLQYGTALVGEQCAAPRLRRMRLRPDVTRLIDGYFSARGGQTITSDAVYDCDRLGRPALAYILLATHRSPLAGLQFWNVDTVEIAVGPPARLAGVVLALNEAYVSVQYQPAWLRLKGAQMQGANAAAARALDVTLHESQIVDEIIRGSGGEYFNPLTGEKTEVPAGYDTYCQGLNTVYGSDAGALRPNCQPLRRVVR